MVRGIELVMSKVSNFIKIIIKAAVNNTSEGELSKDLINALVDGVSDKGINEIENFINGSKYKIASVFSEENMKSMNISEEDMGYVVDEIKNLLSSIDITDKIIRKCNYNPVKLEEFLLNEYYKNKGYIENESYIKTVLYSVAGVLIGIERESGDFTTNTIIHISNTGDDTNAEVHKISEYLRRDSSILDVQNQEKSIHNYENIDIKDVKFQKNKKMDYIKNWNSKLFLHQDNEENPITLSRAFIMPDYQIYKKVEKIGFSNYDTLDKIINKFVDYNRTSTMLIIGVPGIGKSTITSWIANEYEYNNRVIILRFLNWKKDELEMGLLNAICNKLKCQNEELEDKILILDGFDEMKALNSREEILDEFFLDIIDFDNFKCIITSRPTYINTSSFLNVLKLLPFNKYKIEKFYERITNKNLTLKKISKDNVEVLGIPVILYMAIMSNIEISQNYTKPELYNRIFSKKNGIFDRFANGDIGYGNGKQILRDPKNIEAYLKFLRKVAILMFKKNEIILYRGECEIPQLKFEGEYVSIIEFPIKHFFESVETNIEFIHRSIYEFFVSESIYHSIYSQIDVTEAKVATELVDILQTNILENEIVEFLKYRFHKSNIIKKKLDCFVSIFEKMMQNGMTYYASTHLKKTIDCEMKTFSNMLCILHLWEFDLLNISNDCISYYLHINNDFFKNNKFNLSKLNLNP